MSDLVCRTLTTFPKEETPERQRSRFKASLYQSIRLLQRELDQIDAESPVLELDLPPNQIRMSDGMPYAKSRPYTPRIVLSYTLPGVGPLRHPCDTFDEWEDNVRAVALTLEHLRSIDRYGATTGRREQYRGFTALPPGQSVDDYMSPQDAALVLLTFDPTTAGLDESMRQQLAKMMLQSGPFGEQVAKRALAEVHPDRRPDDPNATRDFQRANRARELLRQAHGEPA